MMTTFRQNPNPIDRCQLRTRSRSTLEIRSLQNINPASTDETTQICDSDIYSQVDHPGEVVRIRPKKGEVDYQEVHAKARPGIRKDRG